MYRRGVARYLNHDGALGQRDAKGTAFEINGVPEGADVTDQTPNRLSRNVARLGFAIVAAVAAVCGLAAPVSAVNFPHFKSASVTLADSSAAGGVGAAAGATAAAELPDLLYEWTEVGIGRPDVVYSLETVVTATFGCVNGGANKPKATNKFTVTQPLGMSLTRTADDNGRIEDSVILDTHPVTPTDFSCPPGQTLAALSATFTDNTITDTTNGVTARDDDISVTF